MRAKIQNVKFCKTDMCFNLYLFNFLSGDRKQIKQHYSNRRRKNALTEMNDNISCVFILYILWCKNTFILFLLPKVCSSRQVEQQSELCIQNCSMKEDKEVMREDKKSDEGREGELLWIMILTILIAPSIQLN